MSFISFQFLLFLIVLLAIYYIFPANIRWLVLLGGSLCFYYMASPKGLCVLIFHVLSGYLLGRMLQCRNKKCLKYILVVAVIIDLLPLFILKYHIWGSGFIIPIGISFYTLQTIAYHVDIYRENINVQSNVLKYCLFISYFPQILQGPIPRYEQLGQSLLGENKFSEQKIVKGFRCILWGCYLKLLIADKAAIIVNQVFNNYKNYAGIYIFIAGCLYSMQLYTDFFACTKLAQGISLLFGIELVDNFKHPFFSTSIKDFWRRWHISLSSWLRDYVYIPLGGSRCGKIRKSVNIMLTFAISGLWHGAGYKYVFWGGLHGIYQIIGELSLPIREKIIRALNLQEHLQFRKRMQMIITFILVAVALIIFRADTLEIGLSMLKSMCSTFNIWILFDKSVFNLGLSLEEIMVLLFAIGILYCVSRKQEAESMNQYLDNCHICVRWSIYIGIILAILVFGTYGMGYAASEFIYEGF